MAENDDKELGGIGTENIGVDSNDENIDYNAEINRLLEEDAKIELNDANIDYINDVSVYDGDKKDDEDEELESKNSDDKSENEENSEESGLLYAVCFGIIGILIIAIISFSVFLFMKLGDYKAAETEKKKSQSTEIKQPTFKSNSANYIYISQNAEFDGMSFRIEKMLVDSTATLFYINKKINVQNYDIILTDNKGEMYTMDLSFIQSSEPKEDSNETILRFEPLNLNVKNINLAFYNPDTSERINFKFDFLEPIAETPIRYAFDKPIKYKNSDISVNIDHAIFSSSGSRIDYTIKSNSDNYTIDYGTGEYKNSVILEEGGISVRKSKNHPSSYFFNDGNILLNRMDFRSIGNLNNKVYITFKDMFKRYSYNKDIPSSSIGKDGYVIDIDNYRIVIEGMAVFGNRYVLVYHAEDKNIPFDEKNPNANRVEAQLKADLVFSSDSGMEAVFNGVCKSANYGTDMLFDIGTQYAGFAAMGSAKIRVEAILISIDDATIELDLSKESTKTEKKRKEAESDIVDAFEGRLAYKSGIKDMESLSGFSEELVKTDTFLADYSPYDLSENPFYSAQVITSAIVDGKFYGVIQEEWKGVVGIKEIHFHRTHKVTAQKGDLHWIVTGDNVIK